jgi:methylmalonyl-CoA/ethylmalonyl-CoA epimerase
LSNVTGVSGDLLRLHHVGFVVRSIEPAASNFARSLNATWEGEIFHDLIQKVKVSFLSTPGSDVKLELVEPVGDHSPVRAFLENGGGLHHMCFEVDNCEATLAVVRQRQGMIVRRPRPAVAFNGRRIAWALTAEKLLIEFLESAQGTHSTPTPKC